MIEFVIRAAIAGMLFGIWPLVMQKSGMQGNVSSMIFAGTALVAVAPFALRSGFSSIGEASIPLAVLAGVLGGAGLLALNSMLSKVPVEKVGSMIAVMIMVQLLIPMFYQFANTGTYGAKQVGGVLAAVAAILLLI